MDKELWAGLMGPNMLESGHSIKQAVKGNSITQTTMFMKVAGQTTLSVAMVSWDKLMERFIEVAGGMDYSMVKDMKSGLTARNTSESLPRAIKKAVVFMYGMTLQGS